MSLSQRLDTPAGRIVVLMARLGLAAIFVWAAVPKLLDPAAFAIDIENYRVVSGATARAIAVGLPVVELVLALSLLSGIEARGASLVSAGMLTVFAIAMIQAMARDIDLDCGCFGAAAEAQVDWTTILRNAVLVVLASLVVASPPVSWKALRRR